ncbi:catalase-like [Maniola jurtina]|uniref:catalase-like n=1 Tax=Maniola jurtina TaxID=191418 RepID=UPI001E686A54|nr:catalase-like [Maniola jurtina]
MFLLMLVTSVVALDVDLGDPAMNQILYFKERTQSPAGLTTSAGSSVSHCEATSTLNSRLMNNEFFMESITHSNRERIPERNVHAKGAGAFGYFEVTHDISRVCKADFLNKVGKKTPVAVRFSLTTGDRGTSDLIRDSRGFSVKFYTKDGNFDIAGLNTPMNICRDPLQFPPLTHASKRNPATNLYDPNAFWDIITLLPQALFMYLYIFGDRGIPANYCNMPGFGIHTYQVENEFGGTQFVRFHFMPDAGIKNMFSEEARNISFWDPDYLTRNLYKSIATGDFPSWTVSVQILTESDVKKAGPQVFDVTRVVSLKDYPLHQVGKMVLNRNAKNYFAEMEQLAFNPANTVNGILGAPDKIYESRRFAYRDAQLYRMGANFNNIPVNCPFQVKTTTYNRDGSPPVGDNEEDIPNYYPNSFNGPVPSVTKQCPGLIDITETKGDNLDQAKEFYANEMKADERSRLVENLVVSLKPVCEFIQKRAIKAFRNIHPDLGNRVAQGLRLNSRWT